MISFEHDMTLGALIYMGVMGNNNNGFPLIVQLLQNFQYIITVSLIKAACRFVSEDDLR